MLEPISQGHHRPVLHGARLSKRLRNSSVRQPGIRRGKGRCHSGPSGAAAIWTPRAGVQFSLGVENRFDRDHVSPLAGFNRAEGNVVAVGERLPGRGRNLYARLSYQLD